MFRKLEFDTLYYAYLNESPFKYYISILGGVGVQNLGKPANIILARSLIIRSATVQSQIDIVPCRPTFKVFPPPMLALGMAPA